MISFTLDLEPVAKGRPRFWNGHAVTPAKTRVFEQAVRLLAHKHRPAKPLAGPCSLTVRFYFRAPQKPKHQSHIVRPDLDNLVKGVKDAFNGVMWSDDSQINEEHLYKMYDYVNKRARIEVEIETKEINIPNRKAN